MRPLNQVPRGHRPPSTATAGWTVAAAALCSQVLGALPIGARFLVRLGVDAPLDRYLPARDTRARLASAKAIGVPVRNLGYSQDPPETGDGVRSSGRGRLAGLVREVVR